MSKKIWLGIGIAVVLLLAAGAIVSKRMQGMMNLMPANPYAKLTAPTTAENALPVLADAMPEFTGIKAWINSPPLTTADLKGNVVLVDFWTYSCINCLRTLPYVTSWYGKYKDKGFIVIGVHTPEFAFEKVEQNVRDAVKRLGVTYPVALDSDQATWNAYQNQYWPAHYLFDAKGRLRAVHFGEGAYDETEGDIQALLKEAGQDAAMPITQEAQPDFSKIGSPETYVGYARMGAFSSPENVAQDQLGTYSFPKTLELNHFAFSGQWTDASERAVSGNDARLEYRYSASNANLVMGGDGKKRVEILLDGKPVPENFRGADVKAGPDGNTYLTIDGQRLYELTNAHGNYGEHLLELRYLDADTYVYAFTFG